MHISNVAQPATPVQTSTNSDNQNLNDPAKLLNNRATRLASDFLKAVQEANLEQHFNPQYGIAFSRDTFRVIANQAFSGLETLLLEARGHGINLNEASRQHVKSVLSQGLELNPKSHLGWYLTSDFLNKDEHIVINGVGHDGKSALRAAKNSATDVATRTLLGLMEDIDDELEALPVTQNAPH